MAAMLSGWILLLLGVLLAAGGVWLAALGDSWAYIVLGAGWAVTGGLLIARRRVALWAYAARCCSRSSGRCSRPVSTAGRWRRAWRCSGWSACGC